MSSFLEIIRTEYRSEYVGELTKVGKRYTEPKIYHGGKNYDLSKRWYAYYSYLNPDTGKMEKQPPSMTRSIEHTRQERMEALQLLKRVVSKLLKRGYVPEGMAGHVEERGYSVATVLDYALSVKKSV